MSLVFKSRSFFNALIRTQEAAEYWNNGSGSESLDHFLHCKEYDLTNKVEKYLAEASLPPSPSPPPILVPYNLKHCNEALKIIEFKTVELHVRTCLCIHK